MTEHISRLWLKDLFNSLSPEAKMEFERKTGITPDNAPPWLLKGGIEASIESETTDRQYEREDQIRRKQYEFQAKIEQAKAEALRISLNEAAGIIREGSQKDSERLEKILTTVQEGYKQLQLDDTSTKSSEGKYLPTLVSYMDCFRKHSATKEYSEGRAGPSQCVSTQPQPDGVHYRCLVAFASQSPTGFARLKYQIFHAELLRQGDCPKPYSRSITHRIPFKISWLFTKPDNCPFADGGEYVLKNGEFKRVSD